MIDVSRYMPRLESTVVSRETMGPVLRDAIADERERCAIAAESWHEDWISDKGCRRNYGAEIAVKIRGGE